MTRPELSGERNLDFSAWIRRELPDSHAGFCVTNQDWIFWNWRTRQLLLAEEKTFNGDISDWFKRFIREVLHPALKRYCPINRIDYRGYHLIQFSGTEPGNGETYFDRILISNEELRQILSFEIYPPSLKSADDQRFTFYRRR